MAEEQKASRDQPEEEEGGYGEYEEPYFPPPNPWTPQTYEHIPRKYVARPFHEGKRENLPGALLKRRDRGRLNNVCQLNVSPDVWTFVYPTFLMLDATGMPQILRWKTKEQEVLTGYFVFPPSNSTIWGEADEDDVSPCQRLARVFGEAVSRSPDQLRISTESFFQEIMRAQSRDRSYGDRFRRGFGRVSGERRGVESVEEQRTPPDVRFLSLTQLPTNSAHPQNLFSLVCLLDQQMYERLAGMFAAFQTVALQVAQVRAT